MHKRRTTPPSKSRGTTAQIASMRQQEKRFLGVFSVVSMFEVYHVAEWISNHCFTGNIVTEKGLDGKCNAT